MSKVGKIDLETFESFIRERLGRKDDSVVVPPLTGVDAGVIDIGDDKVLIIAEDPIFSVPGQPMEMFGWYTVHIGASDVAVMGVKPRYMTYSLLMPPETPDDDFRTIIDSIHKNADDLGIAIVGGHTGYYAGFMAAGAKAGDDVLLTKGPAVEAAGILAALQPEKLSAYPPELVEKAKAQCQQMTVVKDALTAMEAGGVHAMHDATEGGVRGGLFEVASASGIGMEIDESLFVYPEEIRIVAEGFDFDPIEAIAEGTLLLTVDPSHSQKVLTALEGVGIAASVVGRCIDDGSVRTIKRRDGSVEQLYIPVQDPFWPLFFEALGA